MAIIIKPIVTEKMTAMADKLRKSIMYLLWK